MAKEPKGKSDAAEEAAEIDYTNPFGAETPDQRGQRLREQMAAENQARAAAGLGGANGFAGTTAQGAGTSAPTVGGTTGTTTGSTAAGTTSTATATGT